MARVIKALGVKEIERLSKVPGVYAVGGVPGLSLRVWTVATGTSCAWILRSECKGKETKVTVGTYPTMSLHSARAKAADFKAQLAAGVNPVKAAKEKAKAEKKAAEIASLHALTVDDVLDEWIKYKVDRGDWGKGLKLRAEETGIRESTRIRQNLPSLMSLSVDAATPEDVAAALEPLWCVKRGTAEKVQSHLSGFFKWTMRVKKCRTSSSINPASMEYLSLLLPCENKREKEGHQPALETDQLPHLMQVLMEKDSPGALCTAFAILTCTRSENVRRMRWDQISDDGSLWTIDAIDMKETANGQHVITLSAEARLILARQKERASLFDSPYVFASSVNTGRELSENTLNAIIKRLHEQEVKEGRDGFIDRRQTKEKRKKNPDCKPVIAVQHGISRSTFKTWALETRQDTRAVELILHHKIDKELHNAYDRSDDLPYKKQVLDAWGAFCFSEYDKSEKPGE